jgi:anti-sigma regulatory factor (Ser/Thr protein kinase)
MFPASLEQLHALSAFLEGFCAQAGIDREACLRLNLLLEELFTNTVRHVPGQLDAPVWISLAAGEDRRVTSPTATRTALQPYARLPRHHAEIGRLGGRGVLLLQRLAASRDHAPLRPQLDPPRAETATE